MQGAFALGGMLLASGDFMLHPFTVPLWNITLTAAFLVLALHASRQLAHGTTRGIALSLGVQALQVLHIKALPLHFLWLAGPFLELGASSELLRVAVGGGAVASVWAGGDAALVGGHYLRVHVGFLLDQSARRPDIVVGVNIVALIFSMVLWKKLREQMRGGSPAVAA